MLTFTYGHVADTARFSPLNDVENLTRKSNVYLTATASRVFSFGLYLSANLIVPRYDSVNALDLGGILIGEIV